MTAHIFNCAPPTFAWDHESMALRTGLCLMDDVLCIGPTVGSIIYKHTSEKLAFPYRLKLLLNSMKKPEDVQVIKNVSDNIKAIKRIKHPRKEDIVLLKQYEKYIDDVFERQQSELFPHVAKTGLPQLAPFHLGENKCLHLLMVEPDSGEKRPDRSVSRLMAFESKEDDDPFPSVMVFYDRLAQEVREKYDSTPLAVMPDLNALTTEKLRNLRQRLAPQRKEFVALLPKLPRDGHGNMYYSGRWDLEGIRAFAPRLQQALDATAELEWAANLQKDHRAELHVGNMPCTEVWQLLHGHRVIPDDSWQLLQQKQQSGIHCPTIPFVTITSDLPPSEGNSLTEEEVLTHKRKTIDLD